VVDDSSRDRKLVGQLLESSGDFRAQFARCGDEALAQLRQQAPDVVLTDLKIPDMEGMQFLSQVKSLHPLLPVVLMTSKGSEQIALRALHHGAASYVPKQFLSSALTMTLRDVLAAACRDGGNARLMNCLVKDECAFTLPNDPHLIAPLVSYLQHRVIEIGLAEESERMRVAVGLEEALVNALYHGNLELKSHLRDSDPQAYEQLLQERRKQSPYCDRKVHVQASLTRESLKFVIRDEGPGFDPRRLPDPTEPANLERVSGRGVFLMRTFMDEVIYNETGNQVTLIKLRREVVTRS
jgi:CheY-like chemotaxis protein/anti-sigma regulatory factor (Ser/Thr protein kinase)